MLDTGQRRCCCDDGLGLGGYWILDDAEAATSIRSAALERGDCAVALVTAFTLVRLEGSTVITTTPELPSIEHRASSIRIRQAKTVITTTPHTCYHRPHCAEAARHHFYHRCDGADLFHQPGEPEKEDRREDQAHLDGPGNLACHFLDLHARR